MPRAILFDFEFEHKLMVAYLSGDGELTVFNVRGLLKFHSEKTEIGSEFPRSAVDYVRADNCVFLFSRPLKTDFEALAVEKGHPDKFEIL